jgi:Flp pilus assembly protein TadG
MTRLIRRMVAGRAQSGQAIVLMALLMVGIIMVVGFAIDGSRYFEYRRRAQNAVDMGSPKGAVEVANGRDPKAAVISSVLSNGFDDKSNPITVEVIDHPDLNKYPGAKYVRVTMTTSIRTSFLSILIDSLQTTVRAATLVIPKRIVVGDGNLIATATTAECNTSLSLSSGSLVVKGGAYAPSGDMNATSAYGTLGEAMYVSSNISHNVLVGNTLPAQNLPIYGLPDLSRYEPGGAAAIQAGSDYHFIDGDFRPNFNQPNTPPLKGIYRIKGNFDPIGAVKVDAAGVTIVSNGTITGSAYRITMSSYIDNLLFYSLATSNCGTDAIKFSASEVNLSGGIIIAPDGAVQISAAKSMLCTSIVAWVIRLSGSDTQVGCSEPVSAVQNAITRLDE